MCRRAKRAVIIREIQQDNYFKFSFVYVASLNLTPQVVLIYAFFYKEVEAQKGSKNKEFLRNWPGWNKNSNLRNTKEH